jgi:hypothetical protein
MRTTRRMKTRELRRCGFITLVQKRADEEEEEEEEELWGVEACEVVVLLPTVA